MKYFSTIELSQYSILNCELDQLEFNDKCIINTINQYSYTLAEMDEEFKMALSQSDVLLPDGIGIVIAAKFIENQTIKKLTGSDLHLHLLKKLNSEGGSCFYLGSTGLTLSLIKQKIKSEFPNINVQVYSPPFRSSFTQYENEKMVDIINDFNPDVLFVGMTAPLQEKWVKQHRELLNAKIICSIGAVFDFYAETINRPSKFWQNLGLEWFIRLLQNPKRMAKRYLYYGPIFGFLLLKKKYGKGLKVTVIKRIMEVDQELKQEINKSSGDFTEDTRG